MYKGMIHGSNIAVYWQYFYSRSIRAKNLKDITVDLPSLIFIWVWYLNVFVWYSTLSRYTYNKFTWIWYSTISSDIATLISLEYLSVIWSTAFLEGLSILFTFVYTLFFLWNGVWVYKHLYWWLIWQYSKLYWKIGQIMKRMIIIINTF